MAARTETSSSSDSGRRARGSGRGKKRLRRHGTKRDASTSSSSRSRTSSSSSRGKRKGSSSSSPRRRRIKKGRSRSRDRSASNGKKGRKRRKRSSSAKKTPKQQGAGPRPQVLMPQLWPGTPQLWPMSGAAGKTAQADQKEKEKKKKKKDKKEKKDAAAGADARAEVTALQTQLKALETKLQAANSRAESLNSELDAERGTKESLAKELAAARSELSEVRAGGILQAAEIQAELEAAWAPTIDALEGRLRATTQELRVAARNIEDRDARIQKLGETLAARAVQIGSLSKARECLLTTITRMKQKHAALRVKYMEEAQALPSSAAAEGQDAEAGATSSPATASSSSTATAAAASASAAPVRAAPRAQVKVPAGPLPHRTMSAPSSVLRASERSDPRQKNGDSGEANGQGKCHISFAEGLALEVSYEIASYKDLGKQLWVQKPGTKVYCDQCLRRVPQARGNLQQDPTRSQFSQERFLCEECNSAALALRGTVGDGEQSTGNDDYTPDAANGSQAPAKLVTKRHRIVTRTIQVSAAAGSQLAAQTSSHNGAAVPRVQTTGSTAPASAVVATEAATVATPASAATVASAVSATSVTAASATSGPAALTASLASAAGAGKDVGAAPAASAPAPGGATYASNALRKSPSFAELLTETCRAARSSEK